MTQTDYLKERVDSFVAQLPGKAKLDHYIVTDIVGQGGLFYVLNAYDEDLGPAKSVALKIPRFQEAVAPLVEHKNLLIRLEHPNVPKVIDAELPNGKEVSIPYVAEELCDGTLADKIDSYRKQNRFMPEEEFRAYANHLFAALAHVHSKDIIHKDIKPQNILIGKDGKLKLTDFNLSSATKAEAPKLEQSVVYSFITCVTPSSTTPVEGITDRYASPEQRRWALGEDITLDTRTDVYSLAVVLFEMLTNEAAAGSDSDPKLYNPDAPDLKAFFHKAFRPKREDRHQSIDEMREDFEGTETRLEKFTRIAYANAGFLSDSLNILEVRKNGIELDVLRTNKVSIGNTTGGICFSPDGNQIAMITNTKKGDAYGYFRYMLTKVLIYDLNKKELSLLFQEERTQNEVAHSIRWMDNGICFKIAGGFWHIDRSTRKVNTNSYGLLPNQSSPDSPHEVVEINENIRIISTNPGNYSFKELGSGRLPVWSPVVYERIVKKPKPGLLKKLKRKLLG